MGVRIDGEGKATLGISTHAQGQLGEVVFVELPEADTSLASKETYATLESVKAVAEVYAPIDCEVTESNEQVTDDPAPLNDSPEGDGWLVKIKYDGKIPDLMDAAAYE